MAEDWLSDEIRARSAMFWIRGKADMWPLEVQGNVFLATAILEVGSALFEDWTGDEPALWFLPALDGQRPYHAFGFDAEYAGSLLAKHRPDVFEEICKRNGPPLSDDEWLVAAEIYRLHIEAPRATAAKKMATIHKRMTEALANGKLSSATRTNGGFNPIPPSHWIDEGVAYARFLESQMDPSRPTIQNWPSINEVPPFAERATLVPGNEWIFVTRESLDHFKQQLASTGRVTRETKPFSDKAIRAGFAEFMAANPQASRNAWEVEAYRRFGASSPAARAIWTANTPTGGRKPGPKTRH